MQLALELHRSVAGTFTGTLGIAGTPRVPFTGVMELVAVLEHLLDHGDVSASPDH